VLAGVVASPPRFGAALRLAAVSIVKTIAIMDIQTFMTLSPEIDRLATPYDTTFLRIR
jgi:hypothetical protein